MTRVRFPDHIHFVDNFIDGLRKTGRAQFTAREIAEWMIDQVRPALRGTRRQRLIDDQVPQCSQWLQDYWKRQANEKDPMLWHISCATFGPNAYWEFWNPDLDDNSLAANGAVTTHKGLRVQLANRIERSIAPLIPDNDREAVMDDMSTIIDLAVERIMESLNG
ncbi:MAG: hypothetical protein GEU78_15025 [Actinobacteria bacterium]|nr:hypothetical protein [Actinomycetota bacterium]